MFIFKLQKVFMILTLTALFLLFFLWYKDFTFFANPLSKEIKAEILQKEKELKYLSFKHFNIKANFPIIISDEMPSNRFGMATFDKNAKIKIYLNKKRFKENNNYMINDVLPHEYAHAIMFKLRDFTNKNSGHSKRWQYICKKLEGQRCDRFVNHQDILIEKTNLF